LLAGKRKVTIIARDAAVRRSLAFALDAEGYQVSAYPDIVASFADKRQLTASCTIVDDDTLNDSLSDAELIGALLPPVVLLLDPHRRFSKVSTAGVVLKPYLGQAVIELVSEVCGDSAL
jgi:hypothetical protein